MPQPDSPRRRALRTIPHLRAGEKFKTFELGDALAREHGVWLVPVLCGKPEVMTTLTTSREGHVRCPDCRALMEPEGIGDE